MGRKGDADELVGANEIAQRVGLSCRQLVNDWRPRYPDLPKPVASLTAANLCVWSDIEAWARRTGRLRQLVARRTCTVTIRSVFGLVTSGDGSAGVFAHVGLDAPGFTPYTSTCW